MAGKEEGSKVRLAEGWGKEGEKVWSVVGGRHERKIFLCGTITNTDKKKRSLHPDGV